MSSAPEVKPYVACEWEDGCTGFRLVWTGACWEFQRWDSVRSRWDKSGQVDARLARRIEALDGRIAAARAALAEAS